ncbi:nuclear pore complex protein Nup50-like isoform X2 [Polyodon spathula]|uniref:nuclear pore complex protein Nup50-like isoform X2 n=1 Tax=Polyodon spathula TaxID=7913 RepID=UPI001B7E41D8|nr:nuclear pore complex protein Nup50-like isoform X2 [Polyodon spathula]
MAKRVADKELTDRNWDQEEESEEAGVFSTASEDVMKSRPIKKAKRRNVGTEADSGGTFKGFKGFSLCGAGSGGAGGGAAGFGNGSGFKPLLSLANGSSGLSSTPSFTGFNAASETKTISGEEKGNEEETEEPPKPVVNEVKEDDAFYSKKCKLFYKKENEFKEKGVGTLHLKQVSEQKTQLLVRADTNLGNILLNILVQSSMPCTRMGKNNVMVVCVPNPPVDEKSPTTPVPMLIRVKTAQDADELHKIIMEKKAA